MQDGSTIAERLQALRTAQRLSLAALASRSGVSKSMISKIERGEASPSATTLGRLSEGLNVGISDLLGAHEAREIVVLRKSEQPVFRDGESGLARRAVSPIFPNRGIDVVHNTLPAGATTGVFVGHRRGVAEYLVVLRGRLRAFVGDATVDLHDGDSLFFQADVDHRFEAIGESDADWLLIIDGSRLRDA